MVLNELETLLKNNTPPSFEELPPTSHVIQLLVKYNVVIPEEFQIAAIDKDDFSFVYLCGGTTPPSEKVMLHAVTKNGYFMYNIKINHITPSLKVCLAAVKQNGRAISEIHPSLQTQEVQLAAVKQTGYAIQYIYSNGLIPSEAVQLAAVNKSPYAYKYIRAHERNPSEAVRVLFEDKRKRAFDTETPRLEYLNFS